MNGIKKYLMSMGITLLLIIVFSFILTVFNYFDVLSSNLYKTILLLFLVVSVISGSYYLGYNSDSKGYLNGIVFGILISFVFILLSLVLKEKFVMSTIIYYLIVIITSSIGGTIGINKRTTENK